MNETPAKSVYAFDLRADATDNLKRKKKYITEYGMISDEETGQNKAIRNRIIPVNSLMIHCERRETG